jgi:hypothetical protein
MPERGRSLRAVAQIRLLDDPGAQHGAPPWAALPLFEGNLELALRWLTNNHATLVEMLEAES